MSHKTHCAVYDPIPGSCTCGYSNEQQHETIQSLRAQLAEATNSRDWYKHRCEQLQRCQTMMRDPERLIVCDILANGELLEHSADRYKVKHDEPLLVVQAYAAQLEGALREIQEKHKFNVATVNASTVHSICYTALSTPVGLDALHEVLAQECEKLASDADHPDAPYQGKPWVGNWLRDVANTHREKKK